MLNTRKEELNIPCTVDISSSNICYSDAVCLCVFLLCLLTAWEIWGNITVALWDGILAGPPSLVLDLHQFLEEVTLLGF